MVNGRKSTDPIAQSDFGATNSNTCVDMPFWRTGVENDGAGLLSNVGMPITAVPDAMYLAAVSTEQNPGFSCVANCTYSGLANGAPVWYPTFRFCAMGAYDDGLAHSTTVEFKNTQGASVFVNFTAQSNNVPIPNYTAPPTGVPPTGLLYPSGPAYPFLEFGNVLVGTTKKLTITLTNAGAGVLSGTLGASTNPAFVCSSANCAAPYNLPNNGSSITFEFSFTPPAAQSYAATVDMGPQAGTLTLHGTGAIATFEFETDVTPPNSYTVNAVPATKLDADNDATYVQYKVTSNSPVFTLYLNTDMNVNTGYQGGEYKIETDSVTLTYGRIYQYFGIDNRLGAGLGEYLFLGNISTYGRFSTGGWINILRSLIRTPRKLNVQAVDAATTPVVTQVLALPVSTYTIGAPLDFGTTLYASPSQNKALNFFAINRARVGVVSYSIDMTGAPNFICKSACSSAGLSSPSFSAPPVIEFHPLAEGDFTEPVVVHYDLGDGTGSHDLTFYVHGITNKTGIGLNVPLIRLVPDTYLDMGTVNQGARLDMDVTIFNDGKLPLHVTKIWASKVGSPLVSTVHFGCYADVNTSPSNCNPTVAAGGSRIIKATFQPQTGSGDLYADFNFTSDAFNGPTTPIELHGKATVSSIITIILSSSDFGRVVINKKKLQNVTIQNTGTGDFGSGTLTFTGPFKCVASQYGLDGSGNCKYTLGAGGSTTITLEFAPKTVGSLVGTMELSGLMGIPLPPITGIGISPFIKFIEM